MLNAMTLAMQTIQAGNISPASTASMAIDMCDREVHDDADWKSSIPNALTMCRVLAVPVLVLAFYNRRTAAGPVPSCIFAVCAATDWLDGYLARRWGVHSQFGAFLDPVADKLLVCTCLVLISGAVGAIVAIPSSLIISREIAVSALRDWMGTRGHGDTVAVGWSGKVKTAAQMVALLLLLAPATAFPVVQTSGLILLYLATVLSWTSAATYFSVAWPILSA
jgi:CDP-diacylglycerol--glycerol-3-phosphate 3-phosphatidyltransferase